MVGENGCLAGGRGAMNVLSTRGFSKSLPNGAWPLVSQQTRVSPLDIWVIFQSVRNCAIGRPVVSFNGAFLHDRSLFACSLSVAVGSLPWHVMLHAAQLQASFWVIGFRVFLLSLSLLLDRPLLKRDF